MQGQPTETVEIVYHRLVLPTCRNILNLFYLDFMCRAGLRRIPVARTRHSSDLLCISENAGVWEKRKEEKHMVIHWLISPSSSTRLYELFVHRFVFFFFCIFPVCTIMSLYWDTLSKSSQKDYLKNTFEEIHQNSSLTRIKHHNRHDNAEYEFFIISSDKINVYLLKTCNSAQSFQEFSYKSCSFT